MSYMKTALLTYLDRAVDELVARDLPYRSTPWTKEELTMCLLEMAEEDASLSNAPVNANAVLMTSHGVDLLLERLANFNGWHSES